MRLLWLPSPAQTARAPASFGISVNNILFWDNPMMGSAYAADDSSPSRDRQIDPHHRPGRLLRADGWRPKGRWPYAAGSRTETKKTPVFCSQIRGWRAAVG